MQPKAGTKMRFGLPARPPSKELVEKLQELLASWDAIAEGYLFLGQIDQEKPNLVLGLVLGEGKASNDIHEFVKVLADGIKPFIPEGEFIDFVELTGDMLIGIRDLEGARIYRAT